MVKTKASASVDLVMCTNFYLKWFRNKILFSDLSVSFSTLDLHCFAFIESLSIFHEFPGATTKSHDFPGLENEIIIFYDFSGFPGPVLTLLPNS